jgi:hypothetical protein
MLYKYFKLINILVVLILNSMFVSAFGVTLPYNPVNGYGEIGLYPGQETEIVFMLQNMVGDNALRIETFIKEGKEIASIKGENEILIPTKTKDVKVPVKINVPRKALSTDKFLVSVYFKEIPNDKGGSTFLTTGSEQRFYITITTPPSLLERINAKLPFKIQDTAALLVILLVILIWWFFNKRRSKK